MGIEKYIKVVDNFLSPEQCSAIIRTFKDKSFNVAKIIKSDGKEIVDNDTRKVSEYSLNSNKSYTETHWLRFLTYRIALAGFRYGVDFKLEQQISSVTGIQLLNYSSGGFYKKHVDACETAYRVLSFVIMLNDDYEGGSLNFFEGDELIQEVKPKAGRLIIWPSNFLYPHQASTVKSGRRFVIISWMK